MFEDYKDLLAIIGTIVPLVAAIRLIPHPKKGRKPPLKDPVTYAILGIFLFSPLSTHYHLSNSVFRPRGSLYSSRFLYLA
jgi:hypothetical protein